MGPGNEQPNETVRKSYKSAIAIQKDVIQKIKTEGGNIEKEKSYIADLMIELAKYIHKNEKNSEQALSTLEEAQKQTPNNENIICLKAEIYMTENDRVSCENQCNILLKLNPNNDFASITLAELMLQKDDY